MLGYSDGEFRANDATFTSGGQCEDGLRMIITIGDVDLDTKVPTSDGNSNHCLCQLNWGASNILIIVLCCL